MPSSGIGEAFKPAWWLPGPHAQTLWGALARRRVNLTLTWESLPCPDGDFVDLCWTRPGEGPLLLILHGLEGGIESRYVRSLLRHIQETRTSGAVLMHFRGCGGRPNRRERSYHSGETGDLRVVVAALRQRWPGRRLGAVGFSLGGNVLLKYLAESGSHAALDAAVAVSVPFDLAAGATRLDQGFSRVYRNHLLRSLRRKLADKFGPHLPAVLPARALRPGRLATFRQFDDAVTAPLHGFTGAADYYSRCSSGARVTGIRVPTLMVHARDDPFLPPTAIPRPDDLPAPVELQITARGGHVGFISGRWPWRQQDWLTARVLGYLRHHLQ